MINHPITGLDRLLGLREFLDIPYMKAVRLSALRTGRLYQTGYIPVTYFC